MRDIDSINNPYGEDKVLSACSIFGMMDVSGKRFSGEPIFKAMANMHDRGNGLGGGFAVYGIYPDFADYYALHIMFTSEAGRKATESYLDEHFKVHHSEDIPTHKTPGISNEPLVRRYFVELKEKRDNEGDEIVHCVLQINSEIEDSFVFSSGKNMGVFKGVGYPEEIAKYFRLDEYEGYIWTAHGRFPTNTQAWWGGAHPFCMLDWTVVHNGEISSYGSNKAYLENDGYNCTLHTDTEVMTYAIDLLMRRQGMSPNAFAAVVAPPLWTEIDRMDDDQKAIHRALRAVYGGLLMNGPFAVVIANGSQMIALTDRIRLRPLTAGTRGNRIYLSSEEAAIRLVSPELDHVWTPMGGVPVIAKLGALPTPDESTYRVKVA